MKRGFTLIELIVVISVIAILAGIITPVAGILIDESRITRAKSDVDALGKACLMFDSYYGALPFSGLGGNTAGYSYANSLAQANTLNNLLLGSSVPAANNTAGKVTKSFLAGRCATDPWGTYYFYHNYTTQGRAVLVLGHYGANKANNGVWNWNLWAAGNAAPSDDYYKIFK